MLANKTLLIDQEKEHQKTLLKNSLEIAEVERRKIAADIHDDINPQMNSVKMSISRLTRGKVDAKEVEQIVSHSTKMLDSAMGLAVSIYNNIIPPTLMRSGFVVAIRQVCTQLGKNDVEVRFSSNEEIIDFNQDTQVQLYRLIKEVLNNTFKHAKPSWIEINIKKEGNMLNVFILHNGMEITTEKIKEHAAVSKGIGLKSIFTRAGIIGASVEYRVIGPKHSQVLIKTILP